MEQGNRRKWRQAGKRLSAVALSAMVWSSSIPVQTVSADSASVVENPAQKLALAGLFGSTAENVLNTSRNVTRGEFAQMLVNVSAMRDAQEQYISASLFKDVTAAHGNIAAIKIATNQGWMNAYLDGSFRPEQNVTLRDAAKSVVTMLDYSNADFTGNITNAQLSKYYELELDENITKTAYEYLTVGDCMNLFYNLLNTKTKTGVVYAQSIGYDVTSDGNVALISLLKDELDGPVLATSTWKDSLPFQINSGTTYYRNDFAAAAGSIRGDDVLYYSEDLNVVYAYHDIVIGKVDSIYPNALQAESITLDGNTYQVKNSDIRNEIATWKESDLDKSVVLYTGMDGEIVKMVDLWEYSKTVATGIVTKVGYKDGSYYVEVMRTSDRTTEFTYKPEDITLSVNDVVTVVTYGGENYISKVNTAANIQKISAGHMQYDTEDEEYRIGTRYFHNNCDILLMENGEYTKIEPSELFDYFVSTSENGDYLVANELFVARFQILYVDYSSGDEITDMIVVPLY